MIKFLTTLIWKCIIFEDLKEIVLILHNICKNQMMEQNLDIMNIDKIVLNNHKNRQNNKQMHMKQNCDDNHFDRFVLNNRKSVDCAENGNH